MKISSKEEFKLAKKAFLNHGMCIPCEYNYPAMLFIIGVSTKVSRLNLRDVNGSASLLS
jgi:hypothetical protein